MFHGDSKFSAEDIRIFRLASQRVRIKAKNSQTKHARHAERVAAAGRAMLITTGRARKYAKLAVELQEKNTNQVDDTKTKSTFAEKWQRYEASIS